MSKLNFFQRFLKWAFLPKDEPPKIPDYQNIVDPGRDIIEALKKYEEYYRQEAVKYNSEVLKNLNHREASKREADRALKAMKEIGKVFGKT